MKVIIRCLLIRTSCFLLLTKYPVEAATGTSLTVATRCFREDSKKCLIVSLSQSEPSQEVILPTLTGKNTLQIKRGNLTAFSKELANQLGTVDKLQLGPINLKIVHLVPNLLELTAGGNQIETVEFSTVGSRFKLQTLDLSQNRLTNLTGFEVLVNLRELHLEGNVLEYVDLQVFKNMTLLEKLFLDHNQITTMGSSEKFELPVLEYLSLSGNNVKHLNIENWQLDSLTKWDVSNNKLVEIVGKVEERFPSLQMISVAKNNWHCKWLEATLQQFNESFVMIQDRDEDCQGISSANICCVPENNIDTANDDRLNELKVLENMQKDIRASFERQFGNIKIDNETKLKSLENRQKKLEELSKSRQEIPSGVDINPMKSKVESLKQAVQDVESSLKQQKQLWEKQQKNNDAAQRKLGYTILELKLSLERDIKQIAELQDQFEGLRDLVRNTLESRDTLMV